MALNIKEVLKELRASLKQYVDDIASKKVDKKDGYSLMSDSEINRLKDVTNYDDSRIQAVLDRKIEYIPDEFINETELETILSEYITDSELDTKGYITQHQDLSAYAKKTDVNELTLGLHTDGLVYLFSNGVPQGSGIAMIGGGTGDVIGNIDSSNNIILYGTLGEGTYTIQYEMEDGSLVNVGTLNVNANGGTDIPIEPDEPEEGIKNLLPLSVDENGNDFVGTHANGGDGYEYGYRMNSSGVATAYDGIYISGFIPISATSDRIRIKNIGQYTTDTSYNRIAFYDKSKSFIGYTTLLESNSAITITNGVYEVQPSAFSLTSTNIGFFRFACGSISSSTIVTVNQDISKEMRNMILSSVDSSGALYNGVGWKTGYRISGSSGNESSQTGTEVTGFIPVTGGDTVYIKNIIDDGSHVTGLYNESYAKVNSNTNKYICTMDGSVQSFKIEYNYFTSEGTSFDFSTVKYIRISATEITNESIITVNQEIIE